MGVYHLNGTKKFKKVKKIKGLKKDKKAKILSIQF